MLNSGEKKAVTIILVVAVVFVAVVGVTVGFLVAGTSSQKDEAYMHIAVGDELHTVQPTAWCTVLGENCVTHPGVNRVPVPIGESAVVSVSHQIAEGPWGLVTQYARADGTVYNVDPIPAFQLSGHTYTVVLPSTPDRVLVNVEVQSLSAVAQGDTINLRGLLSADTTPEGFTLREASPVPAPN